MARKTKSMTKGYKGGQSSGTSSSRHSDQPKRPPLTHFLCIPLVTETSNPQLEASLRQFKESVSTVPADETPPSFGTPPKLPLFSPKAVRPIGTIHFTLGVMSLETEERVDKAINYLKSVDFRSLGVGFAGEEHVTGQEQLPGAEAETITPKSDSKNGSLSISLTSLHSMHSPKSTSILYAGPQDPSGSLLPICSKLRSLFEDAGYLVSDDRPLKLHATIVNTIYAKAEHRGGGNVRFDAEALLGKWKDFIWVQDFAIEKLAICKMGAKKITNENGEIVGEEYEEVASIPFVA